MKHLLSEFLKPAEAAERYRIPKSTLIRHIELGNITHYRLGRCIRLKAEDLERELRHEAKEGSPKPDCLRALKEEAR